MRLDIGPHALGVHAFVCRRPDEEFERVYRWLLERNMRMYAVAFGLDHHGDIYLDARLPLSMINTDELDRLLGSVLTYSDESFNSILELGFESSIRKEWEWRISRGESTRNLEAFRGWLARGCGRADGNGAVTIAGPAPLRLLKCQQLPAPAAHRVVVDGGPPRVEVRRAEHQCGATIEVAVGRHRDDCVAHAVTAARCRGVARCPKFSTQGPPLEPPVMSEPYS